MDDDELFRMTELGLEISVRVVEFINPPIQFVIVRGGFDLPTDEEIHAALQRVKTEQPDEYALLMEHVPFPDHVIPKED